MANFKVTITLETLQIFRNPIKGSFLNLNGLVVKGEDLEPISCGFESWPRLLHGMEAKLAITLRK